MHIKDVSFSSLGGLNTSSDVESQVLLRFVTNVVDPLMVCQVSHMTTVNQSNILMYKT
jgi:hypothetical protein